MIKPNAETMTRKPWSHARILESESGLFSVPFIFLSKTLPFVLKPKLTPARVSYRDDFHFVSRLHDD